MDPANEATDGEGTPERRRYARLNVTVPAELLDTVRATSPGLNLSEVMTKALSGRVECLHSSGATCNACGAFVSLLAWGDARVAKFWDDLYWEVLYDAVHRDLTPTGIALMAKHVASRHRIPGAAGYAVPREPKARTQARRRPAAPTTPARPATTKEKRTA